MYVTKWARSAASLSTVIIIAWTLNGSMWWLMFSLRYSYMWMIVCIFNRNRTLCLDPLTIIYCAMVDVYRLIWIAWLMLVDEGILTCSIALDEFSMGSVSHLSLACGWMRRGRLYSTRIYGSWVQALAFENSSAKLYRNFGVTMPVIYSLKIEQWVDYAPWVMRSMTKKQKIRKWIKVEICSCSTELKSNIKGESAQHAKQFNGVCKILNPH